MTKKNSEQLESILINAGIIPSVANSHILEKLLENITLEQLAALLEENNLKQIILDGNENIFNAIYKLYTPSDIKNLFKNDKLKDLILVEDFTYAKEIISMCKSPFDLEQFVGMQDLYNLIVTPFIKPDNIFLNIIQRFNIRNIEDLKVLNDNDVATHNAINYWDYEIFSKVCTKYSLNNSDDLKKLYNIDSIIEYGKSEIIDSYLYLCDSFKSFISLSNTGLTKDIIIGGNKNNFLNICSRFNIDSREKITELSQSIDIAEVIVYSREETLKKCLPLCKNYEDLISLSENENAGTVVKYGQIENLKIIESFYPIKNLADFQKVCEKKNIAEIISGGNSNNLKNLISFYNIDTTEALESFFNSSIVEVIKNGIQYNLFLISKICKDLKDFKEICGNEHLVSIITSGKLQNIRSIFTHFGESKETLWAIANGKVSEIIQEGKEGNFKTFMSMHPTAKSFVDTCEDGFILELIKDGEYNFSLEQAQKITIIGSSLSPEKNLPSKESSWKEIGKLSKVVSKYKPSPSSNSTYLGEHEIEGAFNLANIHTDTTEISGEQERGGEINIGEQKFYSVNDKTRTLSLQHIVNKIFAPYLPMTRLLKIRNQEEVLASINVHDKDAENILKTIKGTPGRINDLLRVVYQFIVLDPDRFQQKGGGSFGKHNLENSIIFDFDYILRSHFFLKQDKIYLGLKKLNSKQKKEIANIFYFFREYIARFINDAEKKGNLTKGEKKLLSTMGEQIQKLSLTHILSGVYNTGRKKVSQTDFNVGIEIDQMLAEKYSETKNQDALNTRENLD